MNILGYCSTENCNISNMLICLSAGKIYRVGPSHHSDSFKNEKVKEFHVQKGTGGALEMPRLQR